MVSTLPTCLKTLQASCGSRSQEDKSRSFAKEFSLVQTLVCTGKVRIWKDARFVPYRLSSMFCRRWRAFKCRRCHWVYRSMLPGTVFLERPGFLRSFPSLFAFNIFFQILRFQVSDVKDGKVQFPARAVALVRTLVTLRPSISSDSAWVCNFCFVFFCCHVESWHIMTYCMLRGSVWFRDHCLALKLEFQCHHVVNDATSFPYEGS